MAMNYMMYDDIEGDDGADQSGMQKWDIKRLRGEMWNMRCLYFYYWKNI